MYEKNIVKIIYLKWCSLSYYTKSIITLFFLVSFTLIVCFGNIVIDGKLLAYDDIGSDTIMQYYPQFTLMINRLKEGNISIWLPEIGVGYNFAYFSIFSVVFLPFLMLGALLGTSSLPILVVLYRSVSIILSSYFAFKFLTLFSNNYAVNSIGAFLYAFNGFAIIWGQHYVYFDAVLYTILAFYYIEKYLRRDNQKFYLPVILISFMCMVWSIYMSYIIYVPLAVYSIIRYVQLNDKFNFKHFMKNMLCLAFNVIIGFVGGLSVALMYVKNIMDSGRVGADVSVNKVDMFLKRVKQSYLGDDLFGSLQRFISANLSGIGDEHIGLTNYYEEPQLFFSALFWIILFQFVFTIHRTCTTRKQIVCKWISVAVVLLATYNKGVLFVLYAFSQDSRRTTVSLFPVFAVMMVIVLNNIFEKKIVSKTGLILGVFVTLFLSLYNVESCTSVEKDFLLSVTLVVVVLSTIIFILICAEREYIKSSYAFCIVSFLLLVNILSEMYISTNRDTLIWKTQLVNSKETAQSQELISDIYENDNSYFRLEKTYPLQNGFTDSFYLNYYPVSTYNSVMTHYIKEYNELFMNPQYLSMSWKKPSYMLSVDDIVQYSSLGVKYILSNYDLSGFDYYELQDTKEGISVYRNLAMNSFSTFFDYVVLKSDFEQLGYIDRNKIQQKALVIDDGDAIFFEKRIKSTEEVLQSYNSIDLTNYLSVDNIPIEKFCDRSLNYDIEVKLSEEFVKMNDGNCFLEMKIEPSTNGTICIYYDTGKGYNRYQRYFVRCDEETCEIRYPLTKNIKSMKVCFSMLPSELVDFKVVVSKEEIKPSDNEADLYEGESSSEIKGHIDCDRDGILYVPVPYDKNWNVKVDEEIVQTYVANSGFLAFDISQGKHDISILYESQEIKIGVFCLLFSILSAMLYCLYSKQKS